MALIPSRGALIQFTFSTYAHLLQSSEQSYSLVADGEYLYNISAQQPMTLLPVDENALTAHVLIESDGVPLLISAQNEKLLEMVRTITNAHLSEKQITLSLQAKTAAISGDSDLLITLLTNLIDNAAKASQAGKRTEVTADETADAYLLAVADEGNGIPADKISLVTEPFYRVDKARSRKQDGAGLGLSLCRMIDCAGAWRHAAHRKHRGRGDAHHRYIAEGGQP